MKRTLRTIAVIGPNAASLSALEGNYNAVPRNPVLPVDGIIAEFAQANVLYAQGAHMQKAWQLRCHARCSTRLTSQRSRA